MVALTISIECLAILGAPQSNEGMHDSDPAVRFRGADDFEWSWHPGDSSERFWPDSGAMLLVEQSAPTLLRVLARHLGWSGDGFVVLRREDVEQAPRWVLRNVTDFGVPPEVRDDGVLFFVALLPSQGIRYRTPYLEALAAAVVWYARVARALDEAGTAILPDGVTVADVEEEHGLSPWLVSR